jgi:signal transduction histidine kinase
MSDERDLILVVDDNETSRYNKERVLSRAGYVIRTSADGLDCLRQVSEHKPRVVVLDVQLPGLDGWEVCTRIKEDPATSSTLVLQVSATYTSKADTVRALEGGADGCLTEPIEPAVLVATVRSLLRVRAAEDSLRAALAREKRARSSAEAAHAAVEAANRSKDEFLATLSHELRSPLGTVLTWTSLLRSTRPDEAHLARGLEVIERNVRLQMKLIDDLLDVSRIVSGKMWLEMGPVELDTVVAAAITNLRPAAEAKGIRLESIIDSTIGSIRGDATRLQQVVQNLLSNGIKFTPRSGTVRVVVRNDGGQAEVEVSDTGKGIEPAVLPTIFERFQQADPSTTRAEGGLGLGLAIVRHIVELHGGTVEARSPGLGGGTTVTVRLPIPEVRLSSAPASAIRLDASFVAPPTLNGVRILAVDDDPDALEAMATVLLRSGATVEAARSAPEAVEAAGRARFDVILSDIAMSGEDGLTLMRKIRALDRDYGVDTPAIALSAYAGPESEQRALSAGYHRYLTKPIDMLELITAVASLVRQDH